MDRGTRLILYFVFVFVFFFVWDYFVLRPKREALLKESEKTEKVEKKPKPDVKETKPVIKSAPKIAHLKFNGYEYLIDLNTGAIFGLNDKKHKTQPSGYIVKPLRVDSQRVKVIKNGIITDRFEITHLGNFRLKVVLKGETPFEITTPITEYNGYSGERKQLFIQYLNGKTKKYDYKNANMDFYTDTVKWMGLRSRYYLVSVWDFKGFASSFKDGDRITIRLYPKVDKEFYIFFGPAERNLLSGEPNMLAAFDLGGGWSTFIAWPIYWALIWFENLTKNYGLAIILLAILIKILTSPLSINIYKSSQKMQKLKPKLEKIQKLYKDDPERLQWETMKLYREAGFNPLSGCLPLLLQLPIFWALYQVLQNAIELKGAEFLLWIKDLSHKDPYYVLPIVMGGISLLNAYLQPGLDPQAKRTSMIMSAVFVFIFLNFPAGIVLYWLIYSLLGIVEQRIYKALWKL